MKFGSQLKGSIYSEWTEYYLDYDGLKKHLKIGEKQEREYTEKDESDFVEKLDKELEKVECWNKLESVCYCMYSSQEESL
jgi:SPX domain protein involved in polyphosphate accumulation